MRCLAALCALVVPAAAAAAPAPLSGSLLRGFCSSGGGFPFVPPSCAVSAFDLTTLTSTDLFNITLAQLGPPIYEPALSVFEDTVTLSVNEDLGEGNSGVLATYNLTSRTLSTIYNVSWCWSLYPDVDAPESAFLCYKQVGAGTGVCPASTKLWCAVLLRIDRATGAETVVFAALPDDLPYAGADSTALDTSAGVLYAGLLSYKPPFYFLYAFDVRTGALLRNVSFPVYAEIDYVKGALVAVVLNQTQQPEPTTAAAFVATVDGTSGAVTPLGPASYINSSFFLPGNFDDWGTASAAINVIFSTTIVTSGATPTYYLLANSLLDGSTIAAIKFEDGPFTGVGIQWTPWTPSSQS